jgi:hypothetical protein
MYQGSALLLAASLAFVSSAAALPIIPFAPDRGSRADGDSLQFGDFQSGAAGFIFVQSRARGGGGSQQRSASTANRSQQRSANTANRGSFNSNDFHRNAANAGTNRNVNTSANRNVNASANRNVNVSGDCCNGNYDDGPTWGGVAAGVAVGAMVGAVASQPAYPPPPPTYPPGYVTPPPY